MKNKRKATFADYARLCRHYHDAGSCFQCPLDQQNNSEREVCARFVSYHKDKANDIIVKWCDEHPIKTRQSEILKQFPKVRMEDGVIGLCPDEFERGFNCTVGYLECTQAECDECRKKFWLEEIK